MNLPGRPAGNWAWRFRREQLEPWRLERMAELAEVFGRVEVKQPGAEAASETHEESGRSRA